MGTKNLNVAKTTDTFELHCFIATTDSADQVNDHLERAVAALLNAAMPHLLDRTREDRHVKLSLTSSGFLL